MDCKRRCAVGGIEEITKEIGKRVVNSRGKKKKMKKKNENERVYLRGFRKKETMDKMKEKRMCSTLQKS